MKIYADENMPYVKDFFAELGEVTLVNGRTLTAEQIVDADVLLVRSVTKVNQQLLSKSPQLKFVGTATIGTDHIDQSYLQQRGIGFSSAPGCNAQSVVEYVLSSLFVLAEKYQWNLQQKTVGVVGVGNIYANESLFKAGILPTKPANQLTLAQCAVLVEVVKQILAQAITQGGTTLKDFSQADGKPGYFKQELLVYGRGGAACISCNSLLEEIRLGQRSTVFCRHCQA